MPAEESHRDTGTPAEHRALLWNERTFLFALGSPAFGMALAYTFVTTYGPVLIHELSGPAVTGLLIGGEGLFSLFVPVLAGGVSDRLSRRFGGRLSILLGGGIVAIGALVLMPLASGTLSLLALALAVFFIGYFAYYTPYYALYPDLVPHDFRGRSLGFQGGLRSAGLLLGISGGGFLLSIAQPLPFAVGAAAIAVFTAGLWLALRTRPWPSPPASTQRTSIAGSFGVLARDPRIRAWFFGNACWEGSVAALRTFVVLYLTIGLGFSLNQSSTTLALVGGAAVLAAPLAGILADRYGHRRTMRFGLVAFGIGLLPAVLTTNTMFVAAIVPVAFAAVILMTLPYSLLMGLLPRLSEHGTGAGVFGLSRGLGVLIGPLLSGLAIKLTASLPVLAFAATKGYSSIFVVAGVLLAISFPLLRRT
ncbi:MFS transporter [Haloechinothrix halophila]|uniref:MFS transporter n=1 Tax=Haloechinothrix halophila TaxID=1069073 RepID=UPI0004046BC5|nr:MFS transporter [Haloechinothrix halophila]